jgi:hypothetical protein
MNATFNDDQTTLSHALDQVISEHGRLRVFCAMLLRLLVRRGDRQMPTLPLNAHLRRDIGLSQTDHRANLRPGDGGLFR